MTLVPASLPIDVMANTVIANVTNIAASLPLEPGASPIAPLYPADGAKVVLWAGPQRMLSNAVRAIEVAFDLPHPTIGGVPAKQSPETRRG